MPQIEIRPAIATDIHALVNIEHGYASDYVWQMDFRQGENDIFINFREVRLPRTAQVGYPKDYKNLVNTWTQKDGLLVAEIENDTVGYIGLNQDQTLRTTRVTDLAVRRDHRRQGIGSALVIASEEWAKQNDSRRLILEMQPKNHPAIQMAKKLGFDLCGYNDHYFSNHDIALFFSKWLR
jgi:ribosomal protein S18 acetylase RimI-like enzyme